MTLLTEGRPSDGIKSREKQEEEQKKNKNKKYTIDNLEGTTDPL
jgi:hypothetical protein